MSDIEKHGKGVDHHDHGHVAMPDHLEGIEKTRDEADVIHVTTENPYKEINFIGTYAAIALGTCAAFAGFIMPVTALVEINEIIGPSGNVTWVALAWVLCAAVGFTLVGRLSDIFGRRWFFTGCSIFGTIGAIIGCTADDINTLIAASVFLGLASAGQISFNYVLGEIVPVRHRFPATGLILLMTFPFSGMGPYIARLMIAMGPAGWRSIYYLTLGLSAGATVCWALFYHPPEFDNLHRNRTKMQEVREMDFGGIVLFSGGLILFLLGLSWGGGLYPWNSAHVVATLVVGLLTLVAFVLYEIFMPLRRPLIPMALFKNYDFVVINILSIAGGVVYYAANTIFPYQVAYLYTTDPIKQGLISTSIGAGLVAGQFTGAFIAVPGGNLKYKQIFYMSGLCAFTAGLAGSTGSAAVGTAMAVLAGVFIGLLEVTVSTAVTIVIDDQSEIGTAGGVFGSLRAMFGVIATAIYVSVFTNKSTDYITSGVPAALVAAGLPASSVEAFIEAAATGNAKAFLQVPGITEKIIEVGVAALTNAYAHAFRVTWLATLGFGIPCVIAALFARDIDDKLSHDVVRRLGHGFVPGKAKKNSAGSDSEVGEVKEVRESL